QLEMFEYLDRVVQDVSPIRPPDPVGHADFINNAYWPLAVDPYLLGQISSEDAVRIIREQATDILANQ
ncbi:MAG: hypothetical protein ACK2UO_00205, partial [Caldilineaceae bacterium]